MIRVKWCLIGLLLGAAAGAWGGVRLFCPRSEAPPVRPADRAALAGAGYVTVPEGPVPNARGDLPGAPALRIAVHMPRRSPARGPGTGATAGPGSGVAPIPPGPGVPVGAAVPPPPASEPPVPVPAGLTSDDLSGDASISLRAAGGELFARADLTCCAGEVCRHEPGAETRMVWDRAALCPRPRLGRLFTVGLTGSYPDAEIALPVAFWREGRRLGYVGAIRYRLERAISERVVSTGEGSYSVVSGQTGKDLRVEAGIVWRFGG